MGQMKKVFEKVFISKAFWEEEAQWSERTGGFSERNKKSRRKRYGTCQKRGPQKDLRRQSFLGRGGTAKRAHFRLLENNKKSRNKRYETCQKRGLPERFAPAKLFGKRRRSGASAPAAFQTTGIKKPAQAIRNLRRRCGGPEGIRTLDLSDANRTLSQLSYRPVTVCYFSTLQFEFQAFFKKSLLFSKIP